MKSAKSITNLTHEANTTFRGKRRLVGVGSISVLGLAVVVWSLHSTPLHTNTKLLSAATKTKNDDGDAGQPRVKLNYFSASWSRVFQDLAESGNMEFIGDTVPRGRFSRMDKTEYSRADAIRIVNKEIEPQGVRLIEKGQFLILIDVATTRPQYPPAVLPKKGAAKPKTEDSDEQVTQTDHKSVSAAKPRRGEVMSADYQEESSESSVRPPAVRKRRADVEVDSERPASKMKSQTIRPVRQAFDEETDEQHVDRRANHPFDNSVPKELENVGAAMPYVTYRAKHLNAVELSKRIYRAMKSEAELVDQGRNGLPAFRVVSGEARTKTKGQRIDKTAPIEFMISIDEARNELLIEGAEKGTDAVLKLLRVVDRPEKDQTHTQIKPTSKYVCQIADQLPQEIDRMRAANARQIARRPADEKPQKFPEQAQRQVPEVPNAGEDRQPKPRAKEPNQDDGTNEPIGSAVGNFRGEVNIEVIDDLNVMIIRGNERDVEQIMEVIKRIEKLSEATAPEVRLIYLKNVDSESLAELMTSVYEKLIKFPGKATQPRESVAIIPISKPNALLIVAPEADAKSIIYLADELDQPVDPQTEFEVFPLKSAVSTDVEVLISEFYKERKALGAKVLVIADPRSNSVIVRARPRDLDEIKELIDRVDRDEVGAVNDMRIFVLKNAVANDVAATINSAIQSVLAPPRATGTQSGQFGQGGGGGGAQIDEQFKSTKSAVLQFLAKDKDSSRMVRSGILSDIRVTPDMHSNSLVVTASEKSMELVEALINTLDRPTSTVSVIKVFELLNADASQMVIQLNSLFNNQPQQGGVGGQGGALRQALGIALANADDASSNLVPLKFSVDQRTNSVIAVGSADALRVVEAILLRLDDSNLRARENKVVRLNNAPALQIAAAITQFFQQQRDLSLNDPNLVSNVEQLEREVIVIPDTISNNLLVSSTPRYMPSILDMIKKLDTVPKQVVIQAMIVEVQLNNTDEFGIELGLQSPILFDRSLKQNPITQTVTNIVGGGSGVSTTSQILLSQEGTPGFNFNNPGVPLGNNILAGAGNVGGQSLTNFSVGRTNQDLGYGGLVLSASSSSVNALLRALSANRKITILSRPQIRALDSQEARVFVGQTVPTVTNFIANQQTGVLTPTLTQRETGIGMNVLPRINQDGNIVIALYAYRSQLSKETVNVTTDSRGVPIGQRITDLSNVQSTVLVPSNSTIVIGGMISSRDESATRKAPLLGDLPIVGHLFRYDSRSTIRTELLIFLTPRIVDGPEEEECLKEVEMGRIHFIESEAEEMHGPLRAIPAPDDLFMDGEHDWIGPDAQPLHQDPLGPPPMEGAPLGAPTQIVPPAPTSAPTNVPPRQQNSGASPTLVPPPPTQSEPSKPTSPDPDPNVTQINALRTLATEADDNQKYDKVTTANWVPPSAPKKSASKLKKSSTTEKQSN